MLQTNSAIQLQTPTLERVDCNVKASLQAKKRLEYKWGPQHRGLKEEKEENKDGGKKEEWPKT